MAADTLSPVVQYLRRVTAPPPSPDLSDGELLERFAGQRDQTAFAALVQRHGPMVMGVCRRLLRDRHEAEDAWQATFLILVRKAGAIARRELVAGWLYGVAYRTAKRARVVAARRQARERPADTGAILAKDSAEVWPDLRPILDEEIQRLPEKYRLPVILCYFENKTNSEAARLLNCPRGTIATRLARARERLRVYLTRRGITLSAGGLALLLSQEAMSAVVPGMLAAGAIRAGLVVTAGTTAAGGISASATILAQGVMRMMVFTKLKVALALILAAGVVGSGSGLVGLRMRASANAAEQPEQKVAGKPPTPAAPVVKSDRATLEDQIYAALRKDHYWKSTNIRCGVWVRNVKERRLDDVLFKCYDSDGVAEWSAHAREAEIHVDRPHQKLLISMRHVYVPAPEGKGWGYFKEREFAVPLSPAPAEDRADQRLKKPRKDAAITLLNFPTPFSLTGESLDPPGKMSLSCDDFITDGQSVTVHGGVCVTQGTTRLECDKLQLLLDQPAKTITEIMGKRRLEGLQCNETVRLEDRNREGNHLVHYTRLVAPAVMILGARAQLTGPAEQRGGHTYRITIGPVEGGLRAAGPGTFLDLHKSSLTNTKEKLTLWRICYEGRMNLRPKGQPILFEDQVEVTCVPSDDPNSVIDPDQWPADGIVFHGGKVTFSGQKSAKQRAGRQLVITDKAQFQSAGLRGQADTIVYDEDTGRVELHGSESTSAALFRTKQDGSPPLRITGKVIRFWLGTRDLRFSVEK